ncbi:hypothetical protein GCM10010915_16750 [Microbacterium faecale]|uniref:Uncharacterized protein n=1 Tax=Microbacterium faecale TaxID=1804630 RepID=A0A917DHX9_9MICO|nr:hypothetical protein [Microbacterium faecale]GGD36745.1 hypothetical protein GCM10010915_16750 [Microbacterium faecale]HJB64091.1 hypothetical protein [Candidatus Microbacterium pullistercoris]
MEAHVTRPARASPWLVHRSAPHPVIRNASAEPLSYARALIRVGDDVITERWGTVLPGDEGEICLCGLDPADVCVTVSWRPAGTDEELLWQFVL